MKSNQFSIERNFFVNVLLRMTFLFFVFFITAKFKYSHTKPLIFPPTFKSAEKFTSDTQDSSALFIKHRIKTNSKSKFQQKLPISSFLLHQNYTFFLQNLLKINSKVSNQIFNRFRIVLTQKSVLTFVVGNPWKVEPHQGCGLGLVQLFTYTLHTSNSTC